KDTKTTGTLSGAYDTTDSFDETDARYLEEICTYIR
ncbi:GAF domain-containing protein, partial [Bacteroides thetaiotaomicron]